MAKPNCSPMAELASGLVDGALGPRDRLRLERHLLHCRACRSDLRRTKAAIAFLRGLPPEPVPAEVASRLLRRFRAWSRARR